MSLTQTAYMQYVATGIKLASGQNPDPQDRVATAELLSIVAGERIEGYGAMDTVYLVNKVASMTPAALAEFWAAPPLGSGYGVEQINPRTALYDGRPNGLEDEPGWLVKFLGWDGPLLDELKWFVGLGVAAQERVRAVVDTAVNAVAKPSGGSGWWVAAAFLTVIVINATAGRR